jgi:hypothetical protein
MPSGSNNLVSFQVTLTGSAQQLPANILKLGGVFKAGASNNASGIAFGTTSGVTAANGYVLFKSETFQFNGSNTNQIWVLGTASDVLYFIGS